jgi:hypothetical protein
MLCALLRTQPCRCDQRGLYLQIEVMADTAERRRGSRGALLLPSEASLLAAALDKDDPAVRACACMAAAARLGDSEQAHFWTHLPATLATHASAISENSGGGAAGRSMKAQGMRLRTLAYARSGGSPLYSTEAIVAEAQRRMDWHESAHGGTFGTGEFEATEEEGEVSRLYDCRILEYVSVGDYDMAVGLAMASPPARSLSFYRNSLLTIAAAGATRFQHERAKAAQAAPGNASWPGLAASVGAGTGGVHPQAAGSAEDFSIQALKVVAEHARSIGDPVTGVTLLCSVGRFQGAVQQLLACNDWPRAITLAAHMLDAQARNALLHAWATTLQRAVSTSQHPWHIASVFVAAGSLRSAAAVLRDAGAAFAAHTLAEASARLGAVERLSAGAPATDDAQADASAPGAELAVPELLNHSGSVFTEPPSARGDSSSLYGASPRRPSFAGADLISLGDSPQPSRLKVTDPGRKSLTAQDLQSHMMGVGATPETPSGSEAAEAGSQSLSPVRDLDSEVSPVRSTLQQSAGKRAPDTGRGRIGSRRVSVPGDAPAADAGPQAATRETLEVLMNLYAPPGKVHTGPAAAIPGVQSPRSGDGREGPQQVTEVVTRTDTLDSMRAAARRHAADVLSEALASST